MGNVTIHTLRHAESTYGAKGLYAGSADVPLSEQGVADCLAAAQDIGDAQVREADITLSIALKTADLLRASGLRVVLSQRLIDRARARQRFDPLTDEPAGAAVTEPDPERGRLSALVQQLLVALMNDGKGDLDHSGIVTYLEKMAAVEVKKP